jgi:Cu/Ag efflux pump CusA
MIGMSSNTVSAVDMSVLARWKIRPRLMGVPGVANVAIYGQRDRQLQVRVDPRRLHSNGVTLTQVIRTTGNALWVSPLTFVEASTPGTGGFVDSPNQRLQVQHISPISTPQQLSEVPVRGTGARALRLGDVTTVIQDHQPLIGDDVSRTPGLLLVIEKFPGANTREVTQGVEEAFKDMAPGLRGITIQPDIYRPVSYLDAALKNAGIIAIIGLALLIVGMLLLQASWRAAVVALVVVPVSLTVAALVLYLLGATLSTITLLGLAAAVSLVIDDVVADIDAVRRRRAEPGRDAEPLPSAVLAALTASRGPLIFATLAILLALVPFLFLGTVATAFSRPLVLTYALAVLASILVAFTLTPALAVMLLRGPAGSREGTFARQVRRLFDHRLAPLLGRAGAAWAVAGVLAVAALAIVPQLGSRSLLPTLQDRNLLLQVQTMPGTSLPEMTRLVAAASREVRALPGVAGVGAHVGRAVSSDQIVNVNSAEMWVTLDPAADYGSTSAAIRAVLRGYPGVRSSEGTYPGDRVAEVTAGQNDDLIVRVFGADLVTLQRKAEQIRAMLAGVPGVADPVVKPVIRQPTADIRVRLAAAQRYGLRPGDVRREATTLTSGLIVGNLYEQSKIFDVVVWGTQQHRSDLTGLGDLLIDTPGGRQVPLKDVADINVRAEPAAITHDDVLRDVAVTAHVTGDPGAVAAAVRSRVAAMPMPYEYHAEVSGNATVKRADLTRTLAYGAVALVGVFLLLQAAMASWRRAALLLLSLPLSVVGGVLAAPLAGGLWSTASLAGLFAVFALAVRNAALLGRRITDAERVAGAAGPGAGPEPVLSAARERWVPLLQTAGATAVVLLPAAVAGSRAGLEFLHPLAVTMLGGLVSLLLVQGYVLPALLAGTGGRKQAPEPRPVPQSAPADR